LKDPLALPIFGSVALGWLVLSLLVVLAVHGTGNLCAASVSAKWIFGLWLLSVLDLLAIAKLLVTTIRVLDLSGEKRVAAIIRASYWGIVKLACLVLFVVLFLNAGQSSGQTIGAQTGAIPHEAIFLGMGSLVMIPLLGGLIWSQRILRHA